MDPVERYLEDQRAQDEADLLEKLSIDSAERARQLEAQVPRGRFDRGIHGNQPPPKAAGEMWLSGGPETPDQGGYGIV